MISAEDIIESGRAWTPTLLSYLKTEEVMARYTIEQRLTGLTIEQRLAGIPLEEVRAYLKRRKNKTLNVNGR